MQLILVLLDFVTGFCKVVKSSGFVKLPDACLQRSLGTTGNNMGVFVRILILSAPERDREDLQGI